MSARDYDLIVIGSGPAGQAAAIEAAKLGRRVALVEREALGGVSATCGAIPSRTARAAILRLTGLTQRPAYGDACRVTSAITVEDLLWRTQHVIEHERSVIASRLRRHGVDVLTGAASFAGPHTLRVDGRTTLVRRGEAIVIAVGTRPERPPEVDFDEHTVLDAHGLAGLRRIPATLTVVGGGVSGLEYASMLAALGVTVTLVDRRVRLLDFVDEDIVDALYDQLHAQGMTLRLGETVSAVDRQPDGLALTSLESGKRIPSETVLYAAGRRGATDDLRLEAAGLEADANGRIAVDSRFRTAQPHIFAAGDVVGFPALASASMEEGRLAARAAFGVPAASTRRLFPYAIHTIPEISFVGRTEQELAAAQAPYVTGIARYRELIRGEIAGESAGLLKLLVNADSRELEGIHIFGTGATELVHVGQAVMAGRLTLDYLLEIAFNYPTFADAYRIAALDASKTLNELAAAA
jgi:NAD(P) transhydrogenase